MVNDKRTFLVSVLINTVKNSPKINLEEVCSPCPQFLTINPIWITLTQLPAPTK